MNRFNAYSVQILLDMLSSLPRLSHCSTYLLLSHGMIVMDGRHESINYPCIASCLAELHAHVCELIARSINSSASSGLNAGVRYLRVFVSLCPMSNRMMQLLDVSSCDVSMTQSPTSRRMIPVYLCES